MEADNETKMSGDDLLILNCYGPGVKEGSLRGMTLQSTTAIEPTARYDSKEERPWTDWLNQAAIWANSVISKSGRAVVSGGGPPSLFTRIGMALRDTKDVSVIAQNGEHYDMKKESLRENRPLTRNRVKERTGFLKKDIVWDDLETSGCFFLFLRLNPQHKLGKEELDSIREETGMEIRGVCIVDCPPEQGRLNAENASEAAEKTFQIVADAVQVAADDESSKVLCFATSAPAALSLAAGAALRPGTFPGSLCLLDRNFGRKGYKVVWDYTPTA